MYNFCTYFDQNYLVRGLTLYGSLARHASPFTLWVLCFDDFTHDVLREVGLPNLRPISLQAFERDDAALLPTKESRSRVEYYFTCTPSWLLHILNHSPEGDLITYLDADLFLYSSPQSIYEELGHSSILIVGHRFPENLHDQEKYGIYNVGFLTFRNDRFGKECLYWWRERCLEWCYDRVENGRFADQKYLDDWPVRFQQVVPLQHKGAGLAPWNVGNYSLTLEKGQVLVDSQPLVFFHFHRFKQMGRWLYDPGLASYRVQADSLLKRHIYTPYLRGLCATARSLSGLVDQSHIHSGSLRGSGPAMDKRGSVFRRAARSLKHRLFLSNKVLQGDLWLVVAGRIL
ncbi:MAG: glycosyl transferase [Anaerolineae bacterium]|nr:glycosyl transferase [Anaerolineae bacterium]NIN94267.1 glycosyl transferase [Anaerolineae bacterium]NIQ77335.1 glycosyl transferase [Anaerolineae bacterium]